MSSQFVHLHLHSQYSLLEATCEFSSLCARAKDFEMPAVALTDNGNMFGVIEFYFAAKKAGIKPILGLEVYLAPHGRKVKGENSIGAAQAAAASGVSASAMKMPNRRLVLLAQNYAGYQTLCRISSIGYQEGFYYKPRIDDEVLLAHNQNIIALSGSLMGDIAWTYKSLGEKRAGERLDFYQNLFGDRFYLELNRTGLKEWEEIEPYLIAQAKKRNIKLVAANDVHYTLPQDQVAQEVLICIGSNKTLQDPSRYRLGSDQFYFKSGEEMRELFADLPEACDTTLEIADRCNVEFTLKTPDGKPIYHLPSFSPEGASREGAQNNVTLKDEIARMAAEGLDRRFHELAARGEPVADDKKPHYLERLQYELNIIDQMGFNGYYLIVQDFINWAKANGVPVGPGRGSGAGSLVAYSLGITDLDPMAYNLIFERFLNPERISMPDFDVDFCQDNRGRVIDYVTKKYGQGSVSQIITFGKLQCKAAIRDVGRVLGMTYGEVDVVAKLVPDKLGITLEEAINTEPRLRELMDDDPKVATLMDLARKIEGLTRHAGIHAAGVIIANGDIVSRAPLYKGGDGENVVQFDMKHAEKLGLIKFDFLGLTTLTHIQNAFELIEKNRGRKITTADISLKDPNVYAIISRGDTAGIFQFESEGITDLIRKAQPSTFEDIVAINALYRPGPMEMMPAWLERRSGHKPVEYMFPELEPILKETHGVIIYQEHVQLIAARIASYSLGEADVLRRAMGKKIAAEMAKQKTRFLDGAKKNGFDAEKSEELFDLMAKFAEYGFNKSHAAVYCVIAVYTAYLKHYYPTEFYAALLTTSSSDTDKVVKYVKDAVARGLRVRPPDINVSEYKFSVDGDDIIFALGAIKGVGQSAVEAIVEARAKQPDGKFAQLEDFFASVDLRRVNKKTIECLIKAGAMDGYGFHRSELMQGYGKFVERAEGIRNDEALGQSSLFAISDEEKNQDTVQLERCAEWSRSTRLAYEKEVLGFYLSGHPLDSYGGLLRRFTTDTIQNLEKAPAKSKVAIAGMITSLKEIITKKGTRMAFGNLEDTTAPCELVIFPDVFAQFEPAIKSSAALIVSGTLEKAEGESAGNGVTGVTGVTGGGRPGLKIIVEKVQVAEDLLKQAKRLTIDIDMNKLSKLALLKEALEKHPGPTLCTLKIHLPELSKVVDMEIASPQGVELNTQLFETVSSVWNDPNWSLTDT